MTNKQFYKKLSDVWDEANLFRDVPDEDLDSAIISHVCYFHKDKDVRIFDMNVSQGGRVTIKKEWTINLRRGK